MSGPDAVKKATQADPGEETSKEECWQRFPVAGDERGRSVASVVLVRGKKWKLEVVRPGERVVAAAEEAVVPRAAVMDPLQSILSITIDGMDQAKLKCPRALAATQCKALSGLCLGRGVQQKEDRVAMARPGVRGGAPAAADSKRRFLERIAVGPRAGGTLTGWLGCSLETNSMFLRLF